MLMGSWLNKIFLSRVQLLNYCGSLLILATYSLLTSTMTLGSNWGRRWMKTVAPAVHGSNRHPKIARIQPGSAMHHMVSDVFSCSNFLLTPKHSGLSYVSTGGSDQGWGLWLSCPSQFIGCMWGSRSIPSPGFKSTRSHISSKLGL